MLNTLAFSMFYLSLLSLLVLFLAFRIVKVRMNLKIGLLDGDNADLARRIRVHGNLLENLLPFSFLYILAELNGTTAIFLHVTGSVFLISRLMHAYGLSQSSGSSFGRFYGILLSWITLAVLIMVNLYQSLMILIQ